MKKSMLNGAYGIVDRYLGTDADGIRAGNPSPTFFQRKSVMNNFCATCCHKNPDDFDPVGMFREWQRLFAATWMDSQPGRRGKPSPQNWRYEARPNISPKNTSPEIVLQRQIAKDCTPEGWVNHVPTCASYCDTRTDSQVCVDLAHRDSSVVTLVELKWASNHPLSAAMEILRYFGLYLFSRSHRKDVDPAKAKTLLDASSIKLWALAPHAYYRDHGNLYNLAFFQAAVNHGLALLLDKKQPEWPNKACFEFMQFPEGFTYDTKSDALRKAMKNVSVVYP